MRRLTGEKRKNLHSVKRRCVSVCSWIQRIKRSPKTSSTLSSVDGPGCGLTLSCSTGTISSSLSLSSCFCSMVKSSGLVGLCTGLCVGLSRSCRRGLFGGVTQSAGRLERALLEGGIDCSACVLRCARASPMSLTMSLITVFSSAVTTTICGLGVEVKLGEGSSFLDWLGCGLFCFLLGLGGVNSLMYPSDWVEVSLRAFFGVLLSLWCESSLRLAKSPDPPAPSFLFTCDFDDFSELQELSFLSSAFFRL